MKKIFLFTIILFLYMSVMAQAPQGFKYQAVARDASGKVLANQTVAFRVSIHEGSEYGRIVYSKELRKTTNNFGLVDFVIGGNTSEFEAIEWSKDAYFVQIELDPSGGADYQMMGTSQLMSVPYALHAKTVEVDKVDDADADPANEIQVLSKNGDMVTLSKGGGMISINDSDADPMNEIQTISKVGNLVTLTKNGGGFVDAVDDADADPTNEIQQLTKSGNTLTLSKGGGSVTIDNADADADATNEIQTLSLSGSSLSLSKGGGKVTLPSFSGDNWGTQSVVADATLTGDGTAANPLKIAQQSAVAGQGLKWNGTSWKPGRVDSDSTNELQTLLLIGNNLSLSKGGGTVTLSNSGGLSLPYTISSSYATTPFSIENIGSGIYTIAGFSSSGYGIYGRTYASSGSGVFGQGTGASFSQGVLGRSGEVSSTGTPGNCGVLGQANSNMGVVGTAISGIGGYFLSQTGVALKTSGSLQLTGIGEAAGRVLTCDANGYATWQWAGSGGGMSLPFSQTINNSATAFEVTNTNGSAIHGINSAYYGSGFGVMGETQSIDGYGVYGGANSSTGSTYGVYGTVNSPYGIGVYGTSSNIAVKGYGTGDGSYGIYGQARYIGAEGIVTSSTGLAYGVVGVSQSTSGTGVYGNSNASSGETFGVHGMVSSSSGVGVQGDGSKLGVRGKASDSYGVGTFGQSPYIGVQGSATASTGVTYGVYGTTSSDYGYGVYGISPYIGVLGDCPNSSGWSGYFNGKVGITGFLGVGTTYPSFPLDVAGCANLNNASSGIALRCNGAEALSYNGTYYSWGYGGSWNYFGDRVFIGASAIDPGSNLLVVNGSAAKPGGGSWSTYSDKRLKDIHGDYNKGLKEIIQLQPVNYSYKKDNPKSLPSDKNYVGFVAQDVQKVFPEAVAEEPDGFLSLDMNAVDVAVINALKELKAENDRLKNENEQIKQRLEKLEKLISK
ncbi:MAG TPA: tail fiber domain-containing protein [Prolixibacteraceae bacterium]|nr:tail fiber domain-containing protein [Prolixibacteraceae bacterium]